MTSPTTRPGSQRGGFALGLVVGLLLGLAVALGVALYVTKVPVPLMNKAPQRTPEQDAAEAQKNKNWDPNAALAGKAVPRPALPAAASAAASAAADPARPASPTPTPAAAPTAVTPAAPAKPGTDAARTGRDPAAILSGQGDAAAAAGADGYVYFVQVGAYSKPEDAEQQRAKLAMQGFTAKISDREQNGRTVHRVRLGPFEKREEAETQQDKVKSLEPETSLVRVERSKQ